VETLPVVVEEAVHSDHSQAMAMVELVAEELVVIQILTELLVLLTPAVAEAEADTLMESVQVTVVPVDLV
jgi:hypothetical protein